VEEALKKLQQAGYRLFGVTNQSGVARGMFTLEQVHALNERIRGYFREHGAVIEEIAVCPHHPEGSVAEYARECDCRKPKPGMLIDLAKRHHLDLSRSWMVGDAPRDAQAGLAAGCRAALVPARVPPLKYGADLDISGRFKEFNTLLEFARSVEKDVEKSVEGEAASHA
jgi:D-glycero-D-manno-heptose 1,7-bisphosphate phosphatase